MINVVDQFYDKVMLSALSSMMENILGEDTREEQQPIIMPDIKPKVLILITITFRQ